MPVVNVPGQGNVSFPDSMSDDDIAKVIKQHSIPTNPSDSIPKANPTPEELRGPAPSRFKQLLTNLPGSAYRSLEGLVKGPQMGEGDTPNISTDSSGRKSMDINSDIRPLLNLFKHPVDSAVQDPIGTVQNIRGLIEGGKRTSVPEAATGMARAGSSQIRPILNSINLIHPLRMIPDLYDAAKATAQGGRDAVTSPRLSPFDIPSAKSLPSSGGMSMSPIPTGIEGTVLPSLPEELPSTSPFDIRRLKMPPSSGGSPIEPKPTGIMGDVIPTGRQGTSWPETPLAQDVGKNAAPAYKQLELTGKIGKPLWKQANPISPDIIPKDAPETPMPAPVQGPLPQPVLPSGRTPGPLGPSQVRPLAPNGPPAPNAPMPTNVAPPGPSQVRPLTTPEPEQPNIDDHETVRSVKDATQNKIDNLAWHLNSAGMTKSGLEGLGKQAEATQNYAILDAIAKEAHDASKAAGRPVPKSGYKSFSGDTLKHVAAKLKD